MTGCGAALVEDLLHLVLWQHYTAVLADEGAVVLAVVSGRHADSYENRGSQGQDQSGKR